MKDIVLLKVYGHFSPAGLPLSRDAARICRQALPQPLEAVANLDGALLSLAFEGIFFPLAELLECLKKGLPRDATGHLDVLDVENWRLERHNFMSGQFSHKSAPLNNVLDHSGF